jgi:hypothetical protein
LVTEAAKQLTYTLANPQPAGPFTQVNNKQLLALQKLAAIFEGALPKHMQQTLTPLIANGTNYLPLRVDIPMSPQREHHSASSPRVVVPTSPNQTTPTSHRRLQTIPSRFVTTTTPNHIVRRSEGPHNLSLDMLAETVQQANHIFSLPIGPSVTPVLLAPTNKYVIIIIINSFIINVTTPEEL